jgi:hypothetical protein
MAVLIESGPDCKPASVSARSQIRIVQSLSSTRRSEKASIVYTILEPNQVFFVTADGRQVRSIDREELVPGRREEFTHRSTVDASPPFQGTVTIREVVIGETGTPKEARCGFTMV